MAEGMRRFWVSWYQPGPDYRPEKWPMDPAFIGYWCSGSGEDKDGNDNFSLCALIDGESEEAVRANIAAHWKEYPDAEERFFNEVAADHLPNDRFPLPDWSPAKA